MLFACLTVAVLRLTALPISGIKTIGPGGDFASITDAFDAITNDGLGGPVILSLLPGYSSSVEDFPLNPPNNATAVNTVTLRPSVSGLILSSGNAGATINLKGVKYFCLDGRVGGEGTTQDLTVNNSSVNQGCCIKFSNDACYNTIRYCKLKGVNTSVSTGGVVIFSTSNASTGNDNNLIEYCDIGDGLTTPANIIISTGSSGKDNSGNIISHCNIYNFFSTGAQCSGLYFPSPSYNRNWTVEGCSFYQTVSRNCNGNFYVISSEGSACGNLTIINNYIGGQLPQCQGDPLTLGGSVAFRGLRITVNQAAVATIQGNAIRNINVTTTSQSQAASAISLVSGSFVCSNNHIEDINYISSGSGSWFSGINAGTGSPVNVNISANIIENIQVTGSSNCSLRGITLAVPNPSTSNASVITVVDNIIGSLGKELSSSLNGPVYGIVSQSATVNQVISNNHISYLMATGTGSGNQLTAILLAGNNGGSYLVSANKVTHCISASSSTASNQQASLIGISCAASITPGQRCCENIVQSLVNTHPSAAVNICGIYYSGPASGNNVIGDNKVYSLALNSISPLAGIIGINIYNSNNSGSLSVYNNMLRLGLDSLGMPVSQTSWIYGICKVNGNTAVCFNSIYLGGTTTGSGIIKTAAYRRMNSNTDSLFNNILVNRRNNAETGQGSKHYACFLSNIMNLVSDGNIYNVSVPGGLIATCDNGLNDIFDIQELVLANPGNDLHSQSISPQFANIAGADEWVNMHLNPAGNCFLGDQGVVMPGMPVDIDGCLRSTASPDPGADEFLSLFPAPPVSGGNRFACAGDTIPALLSTGTGLIKWYSDSLLENVIHHGNTLNTDKHISGEYRYYATDSISGCESPFIVISLTIDTIASAGHVSKDTVICPGQGLLLKLTDYSGNIVKWQLSEIPFTNWLDIPHHSDSLSTGPISITTRYRAAVETAGCGIQYSQPASVAVSNPQVDIMAVLPDFCLNEPAYTLTGGNPPGGSYSGPGIDNGTFSPAQAGAGIHTITYTYADGYGCISSDSVEAVVHALPGVVISGVPGNLCLNADPLTLEGGYPQGGFYSGNGVSGDIFYPSLAGTGTHQIIYSYSDTNACSTSAYQNVEVQPVPGVCILSGNTQYCNGSEGVTLRLSNSDTGVNYLLYKDGLQHGDVKAGNGQPLSWESMGMGIYTVKGQNAMSGCSIEMAGTVAVSESMSPQVFITEGSGNICYDTNSAVISLNGSQPGVSYLLFRDDIAQDPTIMGNGGPLVWAGQPAGIYTLQATIITTGCSIMMDGTAVIKRDSLLTSVITPDPAYVAVDNILELNGNPSGGTPPCASHAWAGERIDLLSCNTCQSPIFSSAVAGDYTYEYSVIDAHGCEAHDNITIHVTAEVMPAVMADKTRCGSGSLIMVALPGAGGNAVQFSLDGSSVLYIDTITPYEYMTPVINDDTVMMIYSRTINTFSGVYSTWTIAAARSVSTALGGFLSGDAVICLGENTPLMSLSGQVGNIIGWEKSLDEESWVAIENTEETYTEVPSSAGMWQYRVLVNLDGCPTVYSESAAVIVNLPVTGGNLTGNGSTLCLGESTGPIMLNGFNGDILYWRKQLNNNSWETVMCTTDNYSEIPVVVGTWQYQAVVVQEGCGIAYSGIFEIMVTPATIPGTLSGSGSICAGSLSPVLTLTGYSGQIVKWQKRNGNADWQDIPWSSPQFAEIINQAGDWSYRSVVQNSGCQPEYSTAVNLVVLAVPVGGQVVGSSNVCLGSTEVNLHLTGYSGTIMKWQKKFEGGNWVDIDYHQAWYHAVPVATGLWQYRAVISQNSCGFAFSAPAQIMVYSPTIAGTVSGSNIICQGSTTGNLTLTGYTGSILKWQKRFGSSNWTDIQHNTSAYSEFVNVPGTWQYRAVVKNGSCSEEYATPAEVTVQAASVGGVITGGGEICYPEAIPQLNLINYSGTIIHWQKRCNSGVWVDLSDSSAVYNEIPGSPGTWEYRAAVRNGLCNESVSGIATVIVSPSPFIFELTGTDGICEDETTTTLTLSGSQSGVAYQLLKEGESTGLPIQGNGLPLIWPVATPGTYSIAATNSLSFCTMLMNGIVHVVGRPLPAVFNVYAAGYDCNGAGKGEVLLDGSEMAIAYQLYKNELPTGPVQFGTGQALHWNDLSVGNYTVIAADPGSMCDVTMDGVALVIEVPAPSAFSLTGGGLICSNDSVQIGISASQPGVVYHLMLDGNVVESVMIQGNGGPMDFGFFNTPGVYSARGINLQTGCSVESQQSVIVEIQQVPEVFAGDEIYCYFGATVLLPAAVSGGEPPWTIHWVPATGLNSDTLLNPMVMVDDTLIYTLFVTDNKGCTASDEVLLTPVLPEGQSAAKGRVFYANSNHTPLSNTAVLLTTPGGNIVFQTNTNDSGYFQIPAFPNGQYKLTVSCNKPAGGINTTDAMLTLRSYVQMAPLYGIYHMAADVDGSGFVNAVDALSTQRFFIGLLTDFPAGAWVFESKEFDFQGNIYTLDIRGLCYGDVNGSYVPPHD